MFRGSSGVQPESKGDLAGPPMETEWQYYLAGSCPSQSSAATGYSAAAWLPLIKAQARLVHSKTFFN
jgi:hypothetical protein